MHRRKTLIYETKAYENKVWKIILLNESKVTKPNRVKIMLQPSSSKIKPSRPINLVINNNLEK